MPRRRNYRQSNLDPMFEAVPIDTPCESPTCDRTIRQGQQALYFPDSETYLCRACAAEEGRVTRRADTLADLGHAAQGDLPENDIPD